MYFLCYGFCLQAVTALQDTSINIKRKNGKRKIILLKLSIPDLDLMSFLNKGNCLVFGTCAAIFFRHSS